MALSIQLTGFASNDPVPGNVFELSFAQGQASSGSTSQAILLIGNLLTGNQGAVETVQGPDTQTPLATQTDANNLFGTKSELARKFKRVLAVNADVPVQAIAATESAGAKSTGTITFATTATANGFARIWVADEQVDVAITVGDTPTVIATNAVAAINAKPDWPATATNASGVVTISATQKGLRGNWLYYQAAIFGTSVGTTVTPTTDTLMTGGTTADSWTNVLAAILPNRYYQIVSADDGAATTNLSSLVSQVNTQATPINGIRQRVFAASVDSLANTITVATGLNAARAEMYLQYKGNVPPCELAANMAAIVALKEAAFGPRSCNFDGYGTTPTSQAYWKVPVPRSGTSLTRTQQASALNNGISPIVNVSRRATKLVSRITTRCLSGSNPDYRIRDAHKVSVCDRFVDDLEARMNAQLSEAIIGDDPPVGTRPVAGVVTPRDVKALSMALIREQGEAKLLQNVQTIIDNLIVVREASPATRISQRIPLSVADVLHQTATAVDEVSKG